MFFMFVITELSETFQLKFFFAGKKYRFGSVRTFCPFVSISVNHIGQNKKQKTKKPPKKPEMSIHHFSFSG